MADRQVEIIATPTSERFRFNNPGDDVVIMSARCEVDGKKQMISIKGPTEGREPTIGLPYRFYGTWGTYTNRRTGQNEKQFSFRSFVRNGQPKGRDAVVAYLSQAPSLGRVTAVRIYSAFGEGSVEALKTRPAEVAAKVERFNQAAAENVARWLEDNSKLEQVTIELTGLLMGKGLPKTVIRSAVKAWGNKAPAIIKQNPYRLTQFHGVGFKRADALYLEFGHRPGRIKRQALCCQEGVRTSSSGDTWHYHEVARGAVRQSIAGAELNIEKALRLAVRGGLLASIYTDGVEGPLDMMGDCQWVADRRQAENERRLADRASAIMRGKSKWQNFLPQLKESDLSPHQLTELTKALQSPLGILGGSPGTGKTFTVAALVKTILKRHGESRIAIAAPTGKAAVRCTESMAANGVEVTATTIHSLLGVDVVDGQLGFAHHQHHPLPHGLVIVDESSMVDTDLMRSLFDAIPDGGHVLLVGDVNQLLPVGHGAPLRDFTAAGVPAGQLTEIKRNSGGIVEACRAIRLEESFELGDNFHHRQCESVVDVVSEFAEGEIDPTWDVQIVTAVNEKSEKSRKALNTELQEALNPNPKREGTPFRLDDKIVCTKNGYLPAGGKVGPGARTNGDGDVYVANGEIGRVVGFDGRRMKVSLADPNRDVLVPLGKVVDGFAGCYWDLAYALSVHKSQGSEFPVVIVCLDESAAADRVGDRAWIYTAISRARQQCVLWGDIEIARKWCRRNRISKRKTFLKELVELPEPAGATLPLQIADQEQVQEIPVAAM